VAYYLATFNTIDSQYRLSRSRHGSPRHSLASSFLAKTMSGAVIVSRLCELRRSNPRRYAVIDRHVAPASLEKNSNEAGGDRILFSNSYFNFERSKNAGTGHKLLTIIYTLYKF